MLFENLEVHLLSGAVFIEDDANTFIRSCLFSDLHVPSFLSFMNEEDSSSDSDSDSSPEIFCSFDLVVDGILPRSPASDSGQAPYPDQLVRRELLPSPPHDSILQNIGGALVEKTEGQPNGDGFSSCGGSCDMILFDQFEIGSNGSAPVEHSCIIVKSVVVEDECAKPSVNDM